MAVDSEPDVVVVGMGPGGEALAGQLASAGWDVTAVESRLVGGECPYFACIPTKMMVRAAEALAETRRVPELAGSSEVRPDWSMVADRIRDEATTDWDDTIAAERFTSTGGRLLRGVARLTGPGEVTVRAQDGDHVLRPRTGIALNPGTEPAVPPIDGLAATPYWTNREAVAAREVPRSLLVLGAGPVGAEFAQVFARFGSAVTVVDGGPHLLPRSEPEAGEVLREVFDREGVEVRTGSHAKAVSHDGSAFTVRLDSGEEFRAEKLLVATGRKTDLGKLGVSAIGLDESAGTIAVDGRMRAAERVWAIGDVTGRGAFTHTSMYQAQIAAEDMMGSGGQSADYRALPAVTYTDPEVATVGLTESQARAEKLDVRTSTTAIPSSTRGWIHKAGNDGVLKLVADAQRGVLVGATVAAPAGGEMVSGLAVALHAQVPISELRRMIFAFPSFHRAFEPALQALHV